MTRHIVCRKTHVTKNGRLAESEENRAEGESSLVRTGLKVRMDIDDESGGDGREHTSLQEQVR